MKLTNPASREYQIMNINLKTYKKILKRSIYAAKQHFLESTFNKYKSDIRNTWKTINKLMSRNKKANCYPSSINIDGIEITNQTDIGHGPDKISVPPKVAKLQWYKCICYTNISSEICDSLSRWAA